MFLGNYSLVATGGTGILKNFALCEGTSDVLCPDVSTTAVTTNQLAVATTSWATGQAIFPITVPETADVCGA